MLAWLNCLPVDKVQGPYWPISRYVKKKKKVAYFGLFASLAGISYFCLFHVFASTLIIATVANGSTTPSAGAIAAKNGRQTEE